MKNTQELIEYLQGTCYDLMAVCDEFGLTLGTDDYAQIDEQIFQCEICGWWYEREEESLDPGVCEDCDEDH